MIVNDLFVVLLQLATTHRLAFWKIEETERGGKINDATVCVCFQRVCSSIPVPE